MTQHDFRIRGWGHDYAYDPREGGLRGSISGWCYPRPMVGDILIIQQPKPASPDGGARYKVVSISYPGDPPDMFFAEVEYMRWAYSAGGEALGPWDEVGPRLEVGL